MLSKSTGSGRTNDCDSYLFTRRIKSVVDEMNKKCFEYEPQVKIYYNNEELKGWESLCGQKKFQSKISNVRGLFCVKYIWLAVYHFTSDSGNMSLVYLDYCFNSLCWVQLHVIFLFVSCVFVCVSYATRQFLSTIIRLIDMYCCAFSYTYVLQYKKFFVQLENREIKYIRFNKIYFKSCFSLTVTTLIFL